MKINNIQDLSVSDIHREIRNGGKFVHYAYCISLVVITLKRTSDVYLVRPNEKAISKGWPYTGVSLLLGWWGFPWGPVHTVSSVATNLSGGKDVTGAVLSMLEKQTSQSVFMPVESLN